MWAVLILPEWSKGNSAVWKNKLKINVHKVHIILHTPWHLEEGREEETMNSCLT